MPVEQGATIQDLLKFAVQYLKNNGVEDAPVLDAQLLLCKVLHVERLYLVVHKDKFVTGEKVRKYKELLQLRTKGMPIQYIVGNQEFMSLIFKVNSNVLIPRHDTEVLVEHVIGFFKSRSVIDEAEDSQSIYSIMDIGTGSGCIAVSLAYYISNSYLIAVDISPEALEVARYNARQHKVQQKISFVQHDILSNFPEGIEVNSLDAIVSNPPYIVTSVIDSLQREVKDYEPRQALDGGNDGLIFYRRIISEAYQYLKTGGLLAFEVGHDQSQKVQQLIEQNGNYRLIKILQDLAGVSRVVAACKK